MRRHASRLSRWAASGPGLVLAALALGIGTGAAPGVSGSASSAARAAAASAANPGSRFVSGRLTGATSKAVTSLQFGPDGRLYAGQQNGLIKAYEIRRQDPGDYAVTGVETITVVQSIPNHDDDGRPNPGLTARLVTGILVTGTPEAPVIYATSSDPRIGGGPSGEERSIDTNSGILSRLTREGAGWRRLDLVRGLPRSEESHATNGLVLAPGGHRLYIAQGGMTNRGAPSHHFVFTPEYALSGAILSVDLAAIGDRTYDLPTLDDETRPGVDDPGDPFGGNDGRNQARLVPGGPVTIYSPGYRNPYDLVLTDASRMYAVDNGANKAFGGVPAGEGGDGRCTNEVRDGGGTDLDALHLVSGPGYYGGHPNPTRANPGLGFNADHQSPVTTANPVECDFRIGAQGGGLVTFPASTNGLAEYRAGNLGGAMAGDLLAAGFDNRIYRLELSGHGTAARRSVLFDDVSRVPLDVTAQGDGDPFPGTIWVGDMADGSITVFEPADYAASGVAGIARVAGSPRR
jgi:hypothetical protein